MTTKQTIDGVLVSRELLERFVSDVEAHNYGFEGLDEVRALLDEPSECRCKRYGKGNPHWPCPVHPVKPSDQHQGVPVVLMELVENKTYGGMHIAKWDNPGGLKEGSHRLYAEQPTPVAVQICDCNQGRLPCNGKCKPTS
ncbi:hypothetical protein [Pseudomonas sp. OVF7]|uniref:hypothetical protein n=1 Tax=unclassified Pseudomonas TaxID=196821 RepID=UPI00272AEE5D|nr:hypothetical protein [Pseudomonas sp. OVF7]WLD64721.1 hypothetical protein QU606_20435 [Pseudomonas sp. OVF7]